MTAESPRPSLAALFSGFFVAGLSGFGGVLPFARRIMVERRGWLTAAEFSDLFSLCQFLPGPNVVNLAAAFGARQRGFAGAMVAIVGLLAAPVAIVIALGTVYERIGSIPPVHHALQGLAAGAAGLFAAAALRIAWPAARLPARAAVVGLAFALFGVLHLPLPAVIVVVTPLSVFVAWRQHR